MPPNDLEMLNILVRYPSRSVREADKSSSVVEYLDRLRKGVAQTQGNGGKDHSPQ